MFCCGAQRITFGQRKCCWKAFFSGTVAAIAGGCTVGHVSIKKYGTERLTCGDSSDRCRINAVAVTAVSRFISFVWEMTRGFIGQQQQGTLLS
jgi:hypothetical protein